MDIVLLETLIKEQTLNLEKIAESLEAFNPFDVLQVGHKELQHSNFIGWLLDPKGSHGAGNYVLKALIKELENISSAERIQWMLSDLQLVSVYREWDSIDILVECRNPRFVICIENKVWAGKTGQDQLLRYKKLVEEHYPDQEEWSKAYVYLTPFPRQLNEAEQEANYQNITYEFIDTTITDVLDTFNTSGDITSFIKSYQSHIQKNILMSDESVKLARDIYKHHKDAIEYIMSKKPVIWSTALFKRIQDHIRSDKDLVLLTDRDTSIIRFLPARVEDRFRVPIRAWSDENLLFAIEIFISATDVRFKFCFGAINSEPALQKSHQEVKNRYYWAMKEFDCLKKFPVSSGPQYKYPAVANYTLFHIDETSAVDPKEFFEFFEKRFQGFKEGLLSQWTAEVENKLQL